VTFEHGNKLLENILQQAMKP